MGVILSNCQQLALGFPSKLAQVICLVPGNSRFECFNLINVSIFALLDEAELLKLHSIPAILSFATRVKISDIWSSCDRGSSWPEGGTPRYMQPCFLKSSPKVSLHKFAVT